MSNRSVCGVLMVIGLTLAVSSSGWAAMSETALGQAGDGYIDLYIDLWPGGELDPPDPRPAGDTGFPGSWLDSDGNVEELIPLWLESGINGVYPMEVAAGMDVVKLRREYGKDLLMTGGIDKRVLARDRKAIDEELEAKIPLAEQGGYIPHIDHAIPHDVPYENFAYYWERKKEWLGLAG